MALKDTWIDKQNATNDGDGDYILAEDINDIAKAVIDLEKENEQKPDSYSKEELDEKLLRKRDIDNFTPLASAYLSEMEETILLPSITSIIQEGTDTYPEINENSLAVNGTDSATFFIDFKGTTNIVAIFTHLVSEETFATGQFIIDGEPVPGTQHGEIGEQFYTEFNYTGEVKNGITVIMDAYSKLEFTTFDGQRIIYNNGFMSGEQAEKLDSLESSIGNIDTALDAILAIQAEYIGGDEA